MLLIRDSQEDAIIHGDRAGKESGGVCAHHGDMPGIATQSRSGGICAGYCPIAGLKRNASPLGRAVRRTETGITDEHLAVPAVVAARGALQLRRSLIQR